MHRPPTTYQVDGAAIRTRRMDLGLTQSECAAQAGITREYLSQLETGARRDMRPPTYQRLRSALKSKRSDRLLLTPSKEQQREEPDAPDEGTPRPHPSPG
ncbi:MAG: helix-turn-helix transcriptional regulator [Streptomyces sp.]|nr:helix-turn-helix transcriptional regulator [Streptomyces sp.]NUP36225.1 helix-turn-helix transcriptional regulator [Streptomyces sp.]NUS75572.1 helix-turn-helix transcriptional regulator [Streptomyces sp.]